MRSSVGTLQNHYLKNDVSLMDDETEPEPKQQQEIIRIALSTDPKVSSLDGGRQLHLLSTNQQPLRATVLVPQ